MGQEPKFLFGVNQPGLLNSLPSARRLRPPTIEPFPLTCQPAWRLEGRRVSLVGQAIVSDIIMLLSASRRTFEAVTLMP